MASCSGRGIVAALDRIVTTTTDMESESPASRNLQVWRLSDLSLLHTVALPDGPAGNEGLLAAEPRLMADGRTLLVSTPSKASRAAQSSAAPRHRKAVSRKP